jgi:hypothetical protein
MSGFGSGRRKSAKKGQVETHDALRVSDLHGKVHGDSRPHIGLRKFWDLQAAIKAADYVATEAFVARLQSFNARLDRQT